MAKSPSTNSSPPFPARWCWSAPARWAARCSMAGSRAGSTAEEVAVLEPQPSQGDQGAGASAAAHQSRTATSADGRAHGDRGEAADPRRDGAAAARAADRSQRPSWSRSWPGERSAYCESTLPPARAIVRAMPNTPAAIGRGITVAVANRRVDAGQRKLAHGLLAAIGAVEWVDDEALMDAVTAVSGSGPAYVFLLAEAMAQRRRRGGPAGRRSPKSSRARPSPARANCCIARRSTPRPCARTSPRPAAPPPRRWRC